MRRNRGQFGPFLTVLGVGLLLGCDVVLGIPDEVSDKPGASSTSGGEGGLVLQSGELGALTRGTTTSGNLTLSQQRLEWTAGGCNDSGTLCVRGGLVGGGMGP